MNKQNRAVLMVVMGIIVVMALTGFFLTKTPVNKDNNDAERRCATSTSTDCFLPTPARTTYFVPPAEEIPAPPAQSGKIDEHLTI